MELLVVLVVVEVGKTELAVVPHKETLVVQLAMVLVVELVGITDLTMPVPVVVVQELLELME
jgi:hypothetical protein